VDRPPSATGLNDYIRVTDLAAAHPLALQLLMQRHSGGVFDLGTGTFTGRLVPLANSAKAIVRLYEPGYESYVWGSRRRF
jgi:UDP-glucose 4-epimerase